MLMLEDGSVKMKNTRYLVPARQNWTTYAETRIDMIQQAFESDAHEVQEGTSASRVLVFAMCLTIARYIYLLEIVKLFCESEGQAWGAAWRYIERYHRQYLLGASNTVSSLSQQLVRAFKDKRVGRRNAAICALVRGSRDMHMLNTAVDHHRAAVRAGEPMEKAERARQRRWKGCRRRKSGSRVRWLCARCVCRQITCTAWVTTATHTGTPSPRCS